jgi:hypothetical protein
MCQLGQTIKIIILEAVPECEPHPSTPLVSDEEKVGTTQAPE